MSTKMTQFFQLPNAVVDQWLMRLSGSALKVYLAVVRKTRGWQKSVDLISISQFELMTGLCRPTVRSALAELLAAGLISVDRSYRIGAYRLNDAAALAELLPVDNAEDQGVTAKQSGKFFASSGKKTYHKVGKNFTPQKDNKINLRKKAVASDLSQQQDLNLDKPERGAALGMDERPSLPAPIERDHCEMDASISALVQGNALTRSEAIPAKPLDSAVDDKVLPMRDVQDSGVDTLGQDWRSSGVKAHPIVTGQRQTHAGKACRRWRIADAAVPQGVSLAVWQQYLAVRHSGRNRLDTQHKYLNLINKLDQLRASGQDVNLCLDQSQQESWLGVFALKAGYVASGYVAPRQQVDTAVHVQASAGRTEAMLTTPTPARAATQVLDRVEAAKRCQDLWRMLGGGVRGVTGVAA